MKLSVAIAITSQLINLVNAYYMPFPYHNNNKVNTTNVVSIAAHPTFSMKARPIAVQLWILSDNPDLNGRGVLAPHTDLGINHLFVGSKTHSPIFYYTESTHSLNYLIDDYSFQTFVNRGHYLALSVGSKQGQVPVYRDLHGYENETITQGKMKYGFHSDYFYACKNISDPQGLSTEMYQLMFIGPHQIPNTANCSQIDILIKDNKDLNRKYDVLPNKVGTNKDQSITKRDLNEKIKEYNNKLIEMFNSNSTTFNTTYFNTTFIPKISISEASLDYSKYPFLGLIFIFIFICL